MHAKREVGVGGGMVRMKKGVIGGGGRVYGHSWKRKRHDNETEKMYSLHLFRVYQINGLTIMGTVKGN